MYEVTAKFSKSTRNKMSWVADIRGIRFTLYIPKWRIPEPIPKRIRIKIYPPNEEINDKKTLTEDSTYLNPQLRLSKIYSEVQKVREHTQTIRFDPLGEPKKWEIGSPYIPKAVLENNIYEKLTIVVEWVIVEPSSIKLNIGNDSNLDKKEETRKIIEDFELQIKDFIKVQLNEYHGEDWWNLGIGTTLRENAEKRKTNKEQDEPRRTYDVMDFLNFNDYLFIINQKKNWEKIFKQFFRKKHIVQANFERIISIRNDLAHNRFNEKDYEKCKIYIEDILKYIPD